ncbi:hypothetical protein EU527_02370 [Candidatus Thorarchaeota archaeon]|nr:MAG: hypothetical protein EU527_02370 [Candidatus Thorarchaeota archaeon]
MQDFIAIAALLREISFGILLAGLFYTFGMFFLGKLFSAIADHGHDVDHDVDHSVEHGDVDHDIEHDVDHDIEHDVDHDIEHDVDHDIEHDVDHDIEHDVDHDIEHDVDHDIEHDVDHDIEHDVDHDIEHDVDHDIEHDVDHDIEHHVEHEGEHDTEQETEHEVEIGHETDTDHSGFFELERGAPLGVTIGTSLVLFGFLGSVFYYDGILIPFAGKVLIQVGGTAFLVWAMRTILGKVFVESGFNIQPKHLVGLEVEAVSTIRDDFGEIRAETEMGLRRFNARPFQKGIMFQKGTKLYVVSADEKYAYVDPRKEAVRWVQKQSKDPERSE